nr:hypothetical protein [Tanacetum cinerariifolium]
MDNKKHIVNLESLREMLHICPRIPGQAFAELPFEAEIVDFIRFLGHSATIRTLTDVNINKLYQPWRSFAAIINKCLTGKTFGYDSLRLSQAEILWGLYHKRNVDYVFLISEDFMFQVEHKNQKKSNEMYYPRFTKVIIHQFISKDLSIPRRNKPIELTNEEIRNSNAYKASYAIVIGAAPPKPKASVRRTRSSFNTSITPPTTATSPRLTTSTKGKQTAKASKAKSLSALSEPEPEESTQGYPLASVEVLRYDKRSKTCPLGVSHWGRKRQQFYGFTVNRESARDVYSKRRIIAVTELKIVEWHSYKHLDWITIRRDDNKLYKFKEYLQLGVESYQKRLNLTKPDTYRSDLKRREAYTPYSIPRGFIYQNKDKKNKLMRIDELHKFSDGTLNDVRTALDDRLKGIRMWYLPQTIWKKRLAIKMQFALTSSISSKSTAPPLDNIL